MNSYIEKINALSIPQSNNSNLTAISFFSGGGGLDLGLSLAGFNFKYASDKEKYYCDTINYNFPDCKTEVENIQNLQGKNIKKIIRKRKVTLIAGGPPCQAFSILGKRESFNDTRGQLVFEYIRLINEIKPEVFIFENVPGILTVNEGQDWEDLYYYFQTETGYDLHNSILNAADFGVPQIRKRVFVIGFRQPTKFVFPEPTYKSHTESNLFTRFLASYRLPEWIPAKFALENVRGLDNHKIRVHGDRVRNRYEHVPQGGRDKVDRTDRIDPEKPSGTVLVGSKAGGGRPFIHPYLPRHITVREAARLQSFPDWYKFLGTSTAQYRQVGNAVPPLVAFAIGKSILSALKKSRRKELVS